MGDKQRRDYGSGSISQRKDGTWTARMIIGTNEAGKPRIKAFYGKSEREVKKKMKEFEKELHKNDGTVVRNHEEIIHISHVFLHAQSLFYEMVKLIQKRNSCNLNHLASGIVTRITLVLCLENSLSPLIYTRRKSPLKRGIKRTEEHAQYIKEVL